ncbi:MAG: hypothetical protein AAGH41_00010 [Pseudomonadota bacterium]
MRGKKRCRLHGGKSPGAPSWSANGNFRHGCYTKDAMRLKRLVTDLTGAS